MTSDYVGTIHDSLPTEYRGQLDALTNSTVSLVDTLLRFALGGECPTNATSETRAQWSKSQTEAVEALHHYKAATNSKRFREEDISPDDAQVAKKAKRSSAEENGNGTTHGLEQNASLYTLHSISITSPLRKKVDLIITQRSLRFVDVKTGQEEKRIPLSIFKRAFLLPTRGKTKPHWTVVLLASDTPAPTGKKAAAAAASSGKDYTQVIFGVDASPNTPFTTTDHSVTPVSPITHPKDTSITPALYAFLSHLPLSLIEPTTSVFKSVIAPGDSSAGVQAYRHAKEGTLWFLDSGVLWDRTPCEYWPLADLVSGDTSEGGMGTDGVRIVSATGRTCSVFFRRRVRVEKQETDMDTDEHEDYVETDVENIDGKEQDGIARWVKQRKHLFGRDDVEEAVLESGGNGKVDKGKGKAAAVPVDAEDSSDEDDSDFVADSESDGGSATSDSESDGDTEGSGDGEGEFEEAEGKESDDEEELDPARHPLLRPGAMPRMSKAAIEAAVGIVKDDFLGGAGGSSSKGKDKGEVPSESSEVEDEEDELDD